MLHVLQVYHTELGGTSTGEEIWPLAATGATVYCLFVFISSRVFMLIEE